MKKLIMFFSCLLSLLGLQAAPKVPVVDHIEPAFWFTGMKQTEVQLMVYGPNIAACNVELSDYPGVLLKNVVELESPNYLLVYLEVAPNAKAGNLTLTFTNGKKKKVMPYELRDREMTGDKHFGFDASDVLYMLMPDRFADGKPESDVVKTMNEYVVDRSHPHDTMTVYRWYMRPYYNRIEIWQGGKIEGGYYSDGVKLFRKFHTGRREWADLTPDSYFNLVLPFDIRGALYNWRSKGGEVFYAGEVKFQGAPVERVFVTMPQTFDRYYYFEKSTGMLAESLQRTPCASTGAPGTSLRPFTGSICPKRSRTKWAGSR